MNIWLVILAIVLLVNLPCYLFVARKIQPRIMSAQERDETGSTTENTGKSLGVTRLISMTLLGLPLTLLAAPFLAAWILTVRREQRK